MQQRVHDKAKVRGSDLEKKIVKWMKSEVASYNNLRNQSLSTPDDKSD